MFLKQQPIANSSSLNLLYHIKLQSAAWYHTRLSLYSTRGKTISTKAWTSSRCVKQLCDVGLSISSLAIQPWLSEQDFSGFWAKITQSVYYFSQNQHHFQFVLIQEIGSNVLPKVQGLDKMAPILYSFMQWCMYYGIHVHVFSFQKKFPEFTSRRHE